MIDYGYLVQAISDWREGKRPDAPPPPGAEAGDGADVVEYEEVQDYEEATVDEYEQSQQGYEQQAAYEQQGYEQQPAAEQPQGEFEGEGTGTQTYAPEGYEAAPEYVERTGTPVAEHPPVAAPPVEDDLDVEVADDDVDLEAVDDADDDDDEAEVDDDDDFERDYDLEEIDDAAGFSLADDLSGYYVAHMRIEMAWEDKPQRHALFAEFGIRNEQHFYQVQATVDRYIQTDDAQAIHGDLDAIMQMRMNAQGDFHMAQRQELAQGELAGDLAPFEDVSLQEWAVAQAKVAGGGDVDEIISEMGIDREKWDRVSAEWNARMSRDTTATIATEYGKAFSGAGQGQFAGAAADGAAAMTPGGDVSGDPPIPFEKWIEIEVAQGAGVEQGKDAIEILASFGMTPLDWSNVSSWWSVYFNRHSMEDGQALFHKYNETREHFEAQYKAGDADEDLDF